MGDLSTAKPDGQPQALPAPKAPSRVLLGLSLSIPILLIVGVLWMTGILDAIGSALYTWGVGFGVIWPTLALWGGVILGFIVFIVVVSLEEVREVIMTVLCCGAVLFGFLWVIWQATFGLWEKGDAKLHPKIPVAEQKK